MNTDALVLKALLLQVDAQKCDRSKRAAFRESAFENCLMARYIDSQCAPALVHMANHIFYSWKRIECECHVTGACMVRLSSTGAGQFAVGDLLRLDRLKGDPYIVRALLPDDDELVVTLDRTIEIEAGAGISSVELCELGEVVRLANEAVACSRNKDSTVEGNYILGKVCHAQGNIDKALEYYLKANESTDMMLAAFGLGQILYSKQEFSAALSIFEKIMLSYPHDKDSQAYVALLKGVLKQETTTFEILREVAVGFQLEYDLWLQQGQLRLGNPSEYGIALKCLLTARQLLITKKESIPADLLSNIAVLKQHVGQVKEALDFMTQALSYAPIRPTPVNQHTLNPDFKSSELDSVFYSWSDPLCQLKYLSFTAETSSTAFESIDAFTDLTEHVHVGDKVCIGDIVYTVNTVSEDQLEAYSPVQLDIASIDGMDEDMTPTLVLDLHLKQRGDNFYSNITLSYNLARILEELGSSGAAVEIYSEILKQHPNFIECYLRLSELARSRGRTVEAAKWLATALEVDREEPDVNISLGDLQSQGKELDRAKKSYESVIEKNKHDARALISLGNFYFSYLKSSEDTKYDSLFKNSYKFFHAALNDDSTGLYAANGLGMVFAEHGELQAAREIFTKVRLQKFSQNHV